MFTMSRHTGDEMVRTRIRKDPAGGWLIEVFNGTGWYLKRWVAGNRRDAAKAEREVQDSIASLQAYERLTMKD